MIILHYNNIKRHTHTYYYLLHCPRWGAQRQEMSDLIIQNDAQASMANMLKEAGQICAEYGQTELLERRGGSNNRGCCVVAYGLLFFFFFLFLKFWWRMGGRKWDLEVEGLSAYGGQDFSPCSYPEGWTINKLNSSSSPSCMYVHII